MESRLHRSPIFRQKLRTVPFGLDEPYWIEDENFDLEYHVRNVALPKPGDWRQFCIQASRIHARPLDLNRPLWEIYVIEGLDSLLDLPKDSFALLTKLHHAAIDVERGTEIITLLHDTTPQPSPQEPPEPWFPESPPSALELVTRGVVHAVTSPLAAGAPDLARALAQRGARRPLVRSRRAAEARAASPVTRFNSIVSPYRVFETRRFLLDEFREIRRLVPGAKINDVVLAVCAGALRRYLEGNDELPEQDLSTLTPVYVREPEAVPGARPEAVVGARDARHDIADPVSGWRSSSGRPRPPDLIARAIGARELTDIATQAPAATLAMTSKMLGRALLGAGRRAPLANCAITNVPGPSDAALPVRRAHDLLLGDHADRRRHGPRVRGDELRRADRRFAHLVPRADARPRGLRAVPARQLSGVPGAGAPARCAARAAARARQAAAGARAVTEVVRR